MKRLRLHACLDLTPLHVEPVELMGQFHGPVQVGRQQALNAHRHVAQTSGRIEARRHGEAEIGRDQRAGRATGYLQQCRDSGYAAPGTNTRQALRNQDAVVGIERDHVCHGAQRHQIQQLGGS
jgi:hypothetical protein